MSRWSLGAVFSFRNDGQQLMPGGFVDRGDEKVIEYEHVGVVNGFEEGPTTVDTSRRLKRGSPAKASSPLPGSLRQPRENTSAPTAR